MFKSTEEIEFNHTLKHYWTIPHTFESNPKAGENILQKYDMEQNLSQDLSQDVLFVNTKVSWTHVIFYFGADFSYINLNVASRNFSSVIIKYLFRFLIHKQHPLEDVHKL